MIRLSPGRGPALSRRAFAAGTVALAAAARARAADAGTSDASAADAPAAELPSITVGALAFGFVHWVTATLTANGFDRAQGFKLETVLLASNEATRIAFLGGSVDTIVSDLLYAARLKAEGKALQFLPYSSTEGALIAAAASPIRDVGDLKGKSIGVAGGPLDKNWMLLRADATRNAGLDLAKEARPVFGAPPLLAAKVESGELDCGLLYWSDSARLQAKGFRRVLGVEEIAEKLGAPSRVAIGGFLVKPGAPPDRLAGFAKAVRRAEDLLAGDPGAWAPLRPLMRAPDEATFERMKQAFLNGIPRKPRAVEIADAQAFFAIVAKLGGSALVGNATSLPADLYVDQAVYG